jgi:hypothetical protein
VSYIAIVGFVAPDQKPRSYSAPIYEENVKKIDGYAARGRTVFADVPKRVNDLGVQPVLWAIEQFGWLGAGLGTGSQGTNDIAGANNIDRGASEGGLGKITMELGVPGLAMMLWLTIALSRHLHRLLLITAKASAQHARVAYGLLAFLVANAATFSVATQAFSDLFVLLIIGCCLGFLLAMPVLAANSAGLAPRRPAARRLQPGSGFIPAHGGFAPHHRAPTAAAGKTPP